MSASGIAASATYTGLRALAGCGGCAAKAPPEVVSMLASLAAAAGVNDDAVLVGLAPADDAIVYQLDAERALVATVDFFPPLVDDPADYGTIAAANAVSDIYAMGGTVAFALALSGFPALVPTAVVAEVNRAAAKLVGSCGGAVLGGHTVRCAEPVFGLCVMGVVHPQRIWRKAGAREGDVLLLSKPLGTGLLLSSGEAEWLPGAIAIMRATNQAAAQALQALPLPPHAVTDITGFGLLGHAQEMAEQSNVTLQIDAAAVPLLPGALQVAVAGVRTSAHRSRPPFPAAVEAALFAVLQDPQTSGGLLVAVPVEAVPPLQAAGFTAIGKVVAGPGRVDLG
jgi:selenide,water dikinase